MIEIKIELVVEELESPVDEVFRRLRFRCRAVNPGVNAKPESRNFLKKTPNPKT